jgi:hypothetical protein
LSGVAIACLVCAAGYTALLLFSVVMGFLKREPIYLPTWMLVLPATAAILGYLALRQIRASEGTRAGVLLARWGLWLAVLSGLGSATFSFFTGLAIRQQSDDFLTRGFESRERDPNPGFFTLLKRGEVNAAFLLTVPPNKRQANPQNDREMEKLFDVPENHQLPEGKLTRFRDADFVRLLQQPYDPPLQMQALGVKSWEYVDRGYRVERTYRLTTPEGEFDLVLTVQSSDSDVAGEGRKWTVVWQGSDRLKPVRLTDLGNRMVNLRRSAARFVSNWLGHLYSSRLFALYQDTQPPGQRMHWQHLYITQTVALAALPGGAAASAPGYLVIPAPCATTAILPGLEMLAARKGPLVFDRLRSRGDNEFDERLQRVLPYVPTFGKLFIPSAEPPKVLDQDALLARWEKKNGRLEISLQVGFPLRLSDGKFPPGALIHGHVVVSTDADADVAQQRDPARLWRIERLELDQAIPSVGPGGGGMPKPPPPGRG